MIKTVHERFDESAVWTPPWIRHDHRARYEFVAKYVAGLVVVDCASGDGTGSATYAAAGATVLPFDISAEAVRSARRRHPGIDFQQADALALPVQSRSVDVFVSLETIEHLGTGEESARALVDEVARVLRPGGIFICSTPNRRIYNPGKAPEARPWNPFHTREFDRAEFAGMLERRFREVQVYGQNPRTRLLAAGLDVIGRVPGHLAVRCAQVLKILRAPIDRPEAHRVAHAESSARCEFLVAVCSRPF